MPTLKAETKRAEAEAKVSEAKEDTKLTSNGMSCQLNNLHLIAPTTFKANMTK